MKNECKPIPTKDYKAFTIPKKEWDWLYKEGYLNKKQIKFLKEAEAVGFEVEVTNLRIESGLYRGYPCWGVTDVIISKTLTNKI